MPCCPRNHHSMGSRSAVGFALLDIMITLSLLGVIAAVAIPALRPDDSLKLISAATILAADLEYAQSATLADPDDPIVVRVDAVSASYWLARAATPEAPIERSNGDPYVVVFGSEDALLFEGLGIAVENGEDSVAFDGFGRLAGNDDARIVLSSDTGELLVRIAASTGSVYVGE